LWGIGRVGCWCCIVCRWVGRGHTVRLNINLWSRVMDVYGLGHLLLTSCLDNFYMRLDAIRAVPMKSAYHQQIVPSSVEFGIPGDHYTLDTYHIETST
jgi:hypothetical protein